MLAARSPINGRPSAPLKLLPPLPHRTRPNRRCDRWSQHRGGNLDDQRVRCVGGDEFSAALAALTTEPPCSASTAPPARRSARLRIGAGPGPRAKEPNELRMNSVRLMPNHRGAHSQATPSDRSGTVDPDRIRSNHDHTGQPGRVKKLVTYSCSRPDPISDMLKAAAASDSGAIKT